MPSALRAVTRKLPLHHSAAVWSHAAQPSGPAQVTTKSLRSCAARSGSRAAAHAPSAQTITTSDGARIALRGARSCPSACGRC
jgi:hypothetical protein